MKNSSFQTLICNFDFLMNKFHVLTCFDEKWILTLDFDQKVKVWLFSIQSKNWSIDWKIHLSILCIWDLLNLLKMSRQFHGVFESICELGFPLPRSNSQKLPLCSQNPKNDYFALLVIWSSFLWNYDPNLNKWFIWVHNVDVGQISWGLIVNWP